jgi:hypothetical protein
VRNALGAGTREEDGGGLLGGCYVSPTVLVDVPVESAAWRDEILISGARAGSASGRFVRRIGERQHLLPGR